MVKLESESSVEDLPNPHSVLGCRGYVQIFIFSGIPFVISGIAPGLLNATMSQYAFSLIVGGLWFAISSLIINDRAKARYRAALKSCGNCGYSLVGITIPQCPECGVVFFPFEPPTNTEVHDEITS